MIVPKLRFGEFCEDEWQLDTLQNLTKINQGLQIPIADRFTEKVADSFFYITNEFLREGSEKKYYIKNPSKSVLCNKKDLLMTRTGNTGKVITNVEGAFHNNFFKIKYREDKITRMFLYYFLSSYKTQNQILRLAGTSTIPDLNHGDFYKIKILLPKIAEQQKIADFLTAVDTKIQQLTLKKTLLEKYKKGVSQQIFNQEIRFKDDDGKDFPEWEEKKLGSIGEIIGGGTPDTSISEYWEGDIYWFTPTEIKFKYLDKSLRTITAKGLKFSSAKTLPKGTLLLSSRATVGDVGIALNECTTNQGFQSIIVNNENENEFIYYWLIQNRKELLRKASGSTFLEINKTEISKLKIFVPIKAEQLKVSAFLKAIDVKIFHTAQQLLQTQTFKKGLLQKMFI